MITLLFTVIFALLASLSAKIGIIYSLAKEQGVRGFSLHLIDGLASGLLLGTVFIILLPIEDHAGRPYGIFPLIALLLYFVLHRFIRSCSIDPLPGTKASHGIGTGLFWSQMVMYVSYGMAIAVGFQMGIMRGIIVSAGIILCQYPESIEYFKGLKQSWSLRHAVIASFLSPYVIPMGAATGLLLLMTSFTASHFTGPLSGITIGLFLYKGISNVITREDGHFVRIASGIVGCLAVVIASRFLL